MSLACFARDAFRFQFSGPGYLTLRRLTVVSAVALAAILLLILSIDDWLAAGADRSFSMYGLNARIALVASIALAVALFARGEAAGNRAWHLSMLALGMFAIWSGFTSLAASTVLKSNDRVLSFVLFFLVLFGPLIMAFWTWFAARRLLGLYSDVQRPGRKAFGFAIALWAGAALLPHWPVFMGDDFERDGANIWELVASLREPAEAQRKHERNAAEEARAMAEAVQPQRMKEAMARIAPRIPGKSNIFVVGVAGWASQQVFIRELSQSLAILHGRFDTMDRTIALANLPGDSQMPFATIQNLAAALEGIGEKMDRENDVLVLTMTSHGSRNGFVLYNNGVVRRELHPEALKAMLDQAGIRNRIVLVSSCYSGTFLRALEDENTMVLTAAAADRTSFGCSDARSWTYFGDAIFAHGLQQARTFADAFVIARGLISKWEKERNYTPSNPQIHIGVELQRRFANLVGDGLGRQALLPVASEKHPLSSSEAAQATR